MTRFFALALTVALLAAAGCTPIKTSGSSSSPSALLADLEASRALNYRIVWQTDLGLTAGESVESVKPLPGVLAVFEKGNVLTLIDDVNGKTRWRRAVGTQTDRFTKPVVYDEHVIICSETQLYAFRMDNGQMASSFRLQHNARTDPIISAGMVILGSPDGLLFAQTLRGGYLVWRYQMGGAIETDPLHNGASLFVADESGQVAGLNPQSGLVVWRRGKPPWGVISAQPDAGPTLAFVACHDQKLYAFERASGNIFWQYLVEHPLTVGPVVIGEHVYQRTRSRGLVCLDTLTGEVLWKTDTPGTPAQLRAEKLMLVDGGNVHMVDAETGKPQGDVDLPKVDQVVFDSREDGNLYLINRSGLIMKLQPR